MFISYNKILEFSMVIYIAEGKLWTNLFKKGLKTHLYIVFPQDNQY